MRIFQEFQKILKRIVVKMLVPEIDTKSELPRCRLMSSRKEKLLEME